MAVKLGATAINALYLGATAINKAYLGATPIFDATAGGAFDPVDASVASLRELGQQLATLSDSSGVQDGQSLTVNGNAAGSYHYRIIDGNHTISAFASNDYFSTVEDSDWEVLVVKGNLTISDDVIPSLRKLGLVIYVTGDLTINNSISMTARGADHSAATGSNVTAAAIRIADGTYSGITDPQIPAAGGGGGTDGTSYYGADGSNGSAGGTGGGGAGSKVGSPGPAGIGADGTSFSGGSGGGGAREAVGHDAASDGGPGGDGARTTSSAGGGAGNPGGAGVGSGSSDGGDGTGGVLVVICLGELSGSGAVAANGTDGGGGNAGGAGSGGGSVTVLYGSDTSSITPTATGGAGAAAGGDGGLGTARKLAIP